MRHLLGGDASPLGWSVQYLHAPHAEVLAGVLALRQRNGVQVEVAAPRAFPDVLATLPPMQAPWTREVVIDCGPWTAYLNNGIDGGDPTAIGPAVARDLNTRYVMAEHTPKFGPGHQATQLWINGPGGEGPLQNIRNLAAVAEDGRWTWREDGQPLVFENTSLYRSRLIRQRLTREVLLQYLEALGIPTDDTGYGPGTLVQQIVAWSSRQVSIEEARAREPREMRPP